MNKTVTPLGTKELSTRLSAPLKSLSLLNSYLDIVSAVKESDKLQGNLHDLLSSYFLHDVGRAMQNLKLSHGGPWHLGVIYRHLLGYTKIRSSIPNGFTQLLERASLFEDSLNSPLVDELLELLAHVLPKEFIKEEMPLSLLPKNIQEPGFISPACHPQLKQAAASYDKKIAMKDNLETELKQVLSKYSISCSSLEYKKQLGAFIELEGTKDNFDKLESDHSEFLHLQTLRGQGRTIRKRFRHSKWMDLHQSILAYHDSYFQAEKQAFQFVCGEIYGHKRLILQIARLIAHLDVNLCFAKLAKENKYCRPTLTDEPVLSVEKGRHPVVEKSLMDEMKSFVPNSCYLSASKKDPQIVVLTGSNMGGKSTYLRQNALISIMAHMGSYVRRKDVL
jgi:DNA mismatch repair protein MutS